MSDNVNEAAQAYFDAPGDDALAQVLQSCDGLIRTCARRFGGLCEEDDLRQTGALGVLRALQTFDGTRCVLFSTWAVHCIVSEIRHMTRREMTAANRKRPGGQMPAEGTTAQEQRQSLISLSALNPEHLSDLGLNSLDAEELIALEEGMERMPPLYETVLRLLFFQGLSQQQAAERLGCSQRKVSRLKCSALEQLRTLLDGDGQEMPVRSFTVIDNKNSFRLR